MDKLRQYSRVRRPSGALLRAGVVVIALAVVWSLPRATSARGRAGSAPNKVVGTWRMTNAVLNPGSEKQGLPYGPKPSGLLVFTPDMHYVEVLLDPRLPKFRSQVRGEGSAEENAAAMAASIGMFGEYSVDDAGEFSGNKVLGSTFPNWVGDVRSIDVLTMTLRGDTMRETFQRPGGSKIVIDWEKVK